MSTLKHMYSKGRLLLAAIFMVSCGAYNFTGGDVGSAETFQVNYFQNYATQSPGSVFDPGLDRDFTLALQDLILTQTSLDLVTSGGDLIYFFYDFPGTSQLASVRDEAHQEIFERINQEIFNRSLADW
jgi:hypothetical protein